VSFLQLLRLDSATIHDCSIGCALVSEKAPADSLEWKKLLFKNGIDAAKCAAASAELLYGSGQLRQLRRVINSGECFSLKELAISGDELLTLGFRGTELGNVLSSLLDHVLAYPDDNENALLTRLAKELRTRRG